MDVANRIDDLIMISMRLVELLTEENDALRSQQPKEVAALLEEKKSLCQAYESRIRGLVDQPEDLAEIDSEIREQVRALGEAVMELIEENGRLLKVGMEANRRVVSILAEAVKTARPAAKTYSASGTATLNGGSSPDGVPISIDRSL